MNRETKHWVITEFYHPKENATGYIMTAIVDAMAKRVPVSVVTVGGGGVRERSEGITAYRVREARLNKDRLLQRVVKQIVESARFMWIICRKIRPGDNVVIVTNPAILLLLAGLMLGRKCTLNIIVHDVFPENLVSIGLFKSEESVIYRVTKWLFDRVYRRADKVIVIGRDMQRLVGRKVARPERVVFIPNFYKDAGLQMRSKDENPLIRKYALENKFVILFSGNIGRMQGIDNLMNVIYGLRDRDDIHFLFVGSGAKEGELRRFVEAEGLGNVTIAPPMPQSEAGVFLTAGDIGLVSMTSAKIRGAGVPSKTYAYLAAGRPVLAFVDEDTEIGLMVEEKNVGWTVDASRADEMAAKIAYLAEHRGEVEERAKNAIRVSEEFFAERVVTEKYADELLNTRKI